MSEQKKDSTPKSATPTPPDKPKPNPNAKKLNYVHGLESYTPPLPEK